METVGMVEWRNRKALSYGMEKKDEKSGRGDERLQSLESSGPFVVRDMIKITMDELVRTADVGVRRGLTVRFESGMVNIFKVSSIEMFLALVCEVAA